MKLQWRLLKKTAWASTAKHNKARYVQMTRDMLQYFETTTPVDFYNDQTTLNLYLTASVFRDIRGKRSYCLMNYCPMMTSSNGNIFRVTGHLCGEFTGPRWILRTKASDEELWCFLARKLKNIARDMIISGRRNGTDVHTYICMHTHVMHIGVYFDFFYESGCLFWWVHMAQSKSWRSPIIRAIGCIHPKGKSN